MSRPTAKHNSAAWRMPVRR